MATDLRRLNGVSRVLPSWNTSLATRFHHFFALSLLFTHRFVLPAIHFLSSLVGYIRSSIFLLLYTSIIEHLVFSQYMLYCSHYFFISLLRWPSTFSCLFHTFTPIFNHFYLYFSLILCAVTFSHVVCSVYVLVSGLYYPFLSLYSFLVNVNFVSPFLS